MLVAFAFSETWIEFWEYTDSLGIGFNHAWKQVVVGAQMTSKQKEGAILRAPECHPGLASMMNPKTALSQYAAVKTPRDGSTTSWLVWTPTASPSSDVSVIIAKCSLCNTSRIPPEHPYIFFGYPGMQRVQSWLYLIDPFRLSG
ncbi:unnamed protein product [Notodromas monacha]|uniref:Uncharacterized protein n=1 Tax=Notodromas monacha TaxID=399045 RepID=A0A7R9GC79_9CRUS|nr:unnamed protein product [Notodromas monacha]CAG0915699.1 unnamed protein product [Notodromas monacha]